MPVETDRAAEHHEKQEGLRGEHRDAGADEGGHKQTARGACHRKPKTLENVRELSNAGSHRGSPPIVRGEDRPFLGSAKAVYKHA
jgi:hypothetical protein